jgi:SAM-dependent methyltransferase
MVEEDRVRKRVREGYAKIAREGLSGAVSPSSCCDNCNTDEEESKRIGYVEGELKSIPTGSNLGLGCGNPVALASLKAGETVIDLGSGGGIDCFLAAKRTGKNGKVIGVDMTPAMIDKARENARKGGYRNVEFRLGEIENLPVADNTADVMISNCVVNLSPNKKRVFEEAFRVLKPGGRLMISDMVLLKELPEEAKRKMHPASCIRGAMMKDKYIDTIRQAGFQDVKIMKETRSSLADADGDPNAKVIVADSKGNQEVKGISELDGKAKKIAREALTATASISVSATKPSKR